MTLIEQLEQTKAETVQHFGLSEPALERRYAPGKWSVRELLHHLCDAETVLFDRIRRVISEPRPVIWAFDQDAWASRLGYAERPLRMSRDIYEATRAGSCTTHICTIARAGILSSYTAKPASARSRTSLRKWLTTISITSIRSE
jgi:hypothetical protein